MRIQQVVASIREEAAGPSYSVPWLCAALGDLEHQVDLHVLAPAPPPVGRYRIHAHEASPFLGKLRGSSSMRRTLNEVTPRSDILHSHGVWLMPNIYPGRSVRGTDCKLFVSPRGMLDPWAMRYHALRKRVVWYAGQRAVLARADCIHATVAQEHEFVRGLGLRAPVAVIPNGVTIPVDDGARPASQGRRRLLFLARIHVKKGVDRLLHAWGALHERLDDWELQIVGNDDGYLPAMRRLAETLRLPRVTFTGKIPEADKSSYYFGADLYILPTETENWGVSVAEALAHGVPAIVGRGAPWNGLVTHDCGWWIDNSPESIVACLETACAMSAEQLRARGKRGRAWMERDYSWASVGAMMQEAYRWSIDGGDPPAWVVTD